MWEKRSCCPVRERHYELLCETRIRATISVERFKRSRCSACTPIVCTVEAESVVPVDLLQGFAV